MINRFRKPQVRYARRMARIAHWDRPVVGRRHRLLAWANMLATDHGFVRLVYLNRFQVTPDFWRAAQPAPRDIRVAARGGVRSIVNLRGGRENGSWPLERETCEEEGLDLIEFVVRSREAPSRETIFAARDLFARLRYPVLVHCKSGADRAGFVAALFLLMHERRPLDEAVRQLSWRYGHFRFAKTGIIDAFFDAYRREGEARGLDLLTWVDTAYDADRLRRDFRPGLLSDFLVERIIRRE